MPDHMHPAELRATRELLGLTTADLANVLHVRHDTARRWESGRDPIPFRVRDEIAQAARDTDEGVRTLIDSMLDVPTPTIIVYWTDAELHAARPDMSHLSARWWRHVAARAAREVPGATIVTLD